MSVAKRPPSSCESFGLCRRSPGRGLGTGLLPGATLLVPTQPSAAGLQWASNAPSRAAPPVIASQGEPGLSESGPQPWDAGLLPQHCCQVLGLPQSSLTEPLSAQVSGQPGVAGLPLPARAPGVPIFQSLPHLSPAHPAGRHEGLIRACRRSVFDSLTHCL